MLQNICGSDVFGKDAYGENIKQRQLHCEAISLWRASILFLNSLRNHAILMKYSILNAVTRNEEFFIRKCVHLKMIFYFPRGSTISCYVEMCFFQQRNCYYKFLETRLVFCFNFNVKIFCRKIFMSWVIYRTVNIKDWVCIL